MNGHRSLLELRMRGQRPAAVFVTVLDHPADRGPWGNAERALENGMHPQIDIEPDDDLPNLDLRAICGTTVHLAGSSYERTRELLDYLIDFEPARVLCCRPAPYPAILDWTPEAGLVEHSLETA